METLSFGQKGEFPANQVFGLAATQFLCGVAVFIMESLVQAEQVWSPTMDLADGFWCGTAFLIAGTSGLIAGLKRTSNMINVTYGSSALALLCGIVLFCTSCYDLYDIVVESTNMSNYTSAIVVSSLTLTTALGEISAAAGCFRHCKDHVSPWCEEYTPNIVSVAPYQPERTTSVTQHPVRTDPVFHTHDENIVLSQIKKMTTTD